jgi:carbohydrate-selective porin OprB
MTRLARDQLHCTAIGSAAVSKTIGSLNLCGRRPHSKKFGTVKSSGVQPRDARQYDSFGVGWYWNEFSNYLKNDITTLTEGMASVKNESGIEAFYDFAVTPAIRFIPSYQHIWNPLAAEVANHQNKADVFLARLTVAF